MEELAKRAVACKHWYLMRGMTLLDGGLVTGDRDGVPVVYARAGRHSADMLPDLTDPATLGCLLALVRQAWNRDLYVRRFWGSHWGVIMDTREYHAHSEAEALVAALEAAP